MEFEFHSRVSEQDCSCDTKIYFSQLMYILVYSPCCKHETFLFIEQGLFTKSKNLCFTLKCTIFGQLKENIYRL